MILLINIDRSSPFTLRSNIIYEYIKIIDIINFIMRYVSKISICRKKSLKYLHDELIKNTIKINHHSNLSAKYLIIGKRIIALQRCSQMLARHRRRIETKREHACK